MEQISDVCGTCDSGTILSPTCKQEECGFVCMHLYKCDPVCYDYTNGHICKHIHRIQSLRHASTVDVMDTCSNSDIRLDGEDGADSSSSDLEMLSYAEKCIPHRNG